MSEQRIAIVCAWFTDSDIAESIKSSRAVTKIAILSKADLNRGEKRAVEILRSIDGLIFSAIGDSDWREGIMHNKYIVADDTVWTGSYNYTFQARKNYETLIRIKDELTADNFYNHAWQLQEEWPIWQDKEVNQFCAVDGAFRCAECGKLYPSNKIYRPEIEDSYMICLGCGVISEMNARRINGTR